MATVFSPGIQSLWDEVSHMPAGGVWWVNADSHADAASRLNQTISAQHKEANVAAIVMNVTPGSVVTLNEHHDPKKIHLFSMSNCESNTYTKHRDLLCSIDLVNYLFILWCTNNSWEYITTKILIQWMEQSQQWAKYNRCTLLILNHGNNSHARTTQKND